MRAFDWDATPLGPPQYWPQSLKTAVRIMLTSRQPIWVGWGPEMIYLYNDPYLSIIGGKHPEALGQPVAKVWHEIWGEIEPMLSTAMSGDLGTFVEEQLLIMERHGYPEETYYTFSYSPIPNDNGVGAGGIICANSEDTARVYSERQMALLRELSARTADARTWRQACELGAEALSIAQRDIPFALLYMAEAKGDQMTLVGSSGIEPDHPAAPAVVRLESSLWPLAEVLQTQQPKRVTELLVEPPLPTGAWGTSPSSVVLLPITTAAHSVPPGVLVVGLNPCRLFDDDYRGFLDLVARQLTASIGNAQAYHEQRERAEALAELDRAKTAFFANVSHEFRTPLTLMLGPLDELLADTMPRETRQLLTMMRRNVLRLKKLVNTLLEFSRLEAGRVRACFEPTDLAAYTTDLASTFRSACERASIDLVVSCPTLPAPVHVDIEMWEKIVLNLISNAFKFTLEGKIEVTLAADDDLVELRVADTGVGIPEEEIPKLFQRFHRVEGIQGRTQEGSGIGLALVHELVRLHGGHVGIESRRRQGTTFSVRIPFGTAHLPADRLAGAATLTPTSIGAAPFVEEALRWIPDGKSDSPPPLASDEPGPEMRTATGFRPHILLADDNADMRDYLRRLLSLEYQVTAVADGQAALERLQQVKPDLVLSDVMMPRLDGFELLAALRRDPAFCDLPVILLSARAGEEARVEGLESGADDYLTKPFSAKELLARITSHLALARLRRESAATLRESEARFRNMADNAPVMIWVTDVDGQCTYLNHQWCEFTGSKPEQGHGVGWLDCVHPEDRAATAAAFESAYAERTSCRLEYRLRRADGEYRWAIDTAAPRFSDGEFLGHIGSVIDVTELKHIEAQLRDADRRKDEFLATLAHELRNPLAPIRTGLEIMRLAGDDPTTTARIRGTLERQTQQIMRLIDDLLDVSRITQGKLELRKSPVDLKEIIDSALEATRPMIVEAGHQLEVERPARTVMVNADPYRMAQILSNLLNNAAKYTPGGGHIWLTVSVHDDKLCLSVKDTGLGIEPAQQEQIFQMFTQLDRSNQRGTAGVGIGLTLVRSLVQLHGGTIEVYSEGKGKGSEFRVLLPVLARPLSEPATRDSVPQPPSRTRRVLVVDDNKDAADTLGAALELMGNEVFTAYDGASALGLAQRHRPEIVLLDLGMPEVDGYEIARRLRAEPWGNQLTLVALTGWGQLGDRQRSRAAGFDQHLVKPVEPDLLRRTLAELPET